MGLDNGIVLQTRRMLTESDVPPWVSLDAWGFEEGQNKFRYEVCYWRKCWNIRDIILSINNMAENDDYEYDLNIKQLIEIKGKFIEYLSNMNKWEEEYDDGRTIWDAEVMVRHMAQDIVNIDWLIKFLKKNNATVIFYDSY